MTTAVRTSRPSPKNRRQLSVTLATLTPVISHWNLTTCSKLIPQANANPLAPRPETRSLVKTLVRPQHLAIARVQAAVVQDLKTTGLTAES